MNKKDEINRIKEASISNSKVEHSVFFHSHLFMMQERQREIISFLNRFGKAANIFNEKVLDIGCGSGMGLKEFLLYGAQPGNLYGVDIIEKRIEKAKSRLFGANFICASAEKLPYEDGFFDIVMQSTAFTSILDDEMKQRIAKEMLRILKDDGIIIWYDFIWNPINQNTKGIGKKELQRLFSDCKFCFKRITLAPPLVRLIVPISWIVACFLEKIPLLRTFYLAIIQKGGKTNK
ncbi:MAG: class I SAM-dependent methyltransferase [Candidatus Desantisbacteria bacterium]